MCLQGEIFWHMSVKRPSLRCTTGNKSCTENSFPASSPKTFDFDTLKQLNISTIPVDTKSLGCHSRRDLKSTCLQSWLAMPLIAQIGTEPND